MKTLFSIIFSVLTSAVLTASSILLFFHYLAGVSEIPTLGAIDGTRLTDLLASFVPFLLAGAVTALFFAILLLLTMHRVRNFFLYGGIALVLSCIAVGVVNYMRLAIAKCFTGELETILVGSTTAFSEFLLLSIGIFFLLAAVFFSIYASIAAVKGEQHEKQA